MKRIIILLLFLIQLILAPSTEATSIKCTDETRGEIIGVQVKDPDNCPPETFCYDYLDATRIEHSCHLRKASTPKEGTCKYLPGPPLQAENNCAAGYAPGYVDFSNIGSGCKCLPKDPENKNTLPDALAPKAGSGETKPSGGTSIAATINHLNLLRGIFAGNSVIQKFQNPGNLISQLLGVVIFIAGFLMVIWVFWGVFQYIFAGGNKEALGKARGRIIWAIVGFIFVILAFAISQYVETFIPQSLPKGVTRISLPSPPPDPKGIITEPDKKSNSIKLCTNETEVVNGKQVTQLSECPGDTVCYTTTDGKIYTCRVRPNL